MATPMLPSGAVDFQSARQLAAHLVDCGNDGIILSGTTGESPTTHSPDKIDLIRAVIAEVGDRAQVIAGAGSNDTAHTVRMARDAETAGAQGLLVVTPYYSKPSQEGVYQHITAVADATELPVMLYDIPGRTGVSLSYETLLRLGEHENIAAVKDAKSDMQQATMVMARTDLAYYSGEDGLNLPWLTIGGSGIVSVVSQVAGAIEKEMIDAVDRSDLPTAIAAHRRLAPLVEAIMTRMPGAVSAKAALYLQGVLPHYAMRGPHVAAVAQQLRDLAAAISEADGIPPVDPARRP